MCRNVRSWNGRYVQQCNNDTYFFILSFLVRYPNVSSMYTHYDTIDKCIMDFGTALGKQKVFFLETKSVIKKNLKLKSNGN